MKQTISKSDFRDAFQKMGRKESFSYDGLGVLFDYLEEYEDSTKKEIELDVIALCNDYTESTIKEALDKYELDTIVDLMNNTTVIQVDNDTIIYQDY